MPDTEMLTSSLRFGPFLYHEHRRELVRDQQPVAIGSRAFDILSVLLRHAGRVIDNDTLVAAAWPHTVVEESNLRVHISALRKALQEESQGIRYIENIPGRGYCFVAEITPISAASALSSSVAGALQTSSVRSLVPMLGRGRELTEIRRLLLDRRCVTITGPGGMGKTILALTVAEQWQAEFPGKSYFIDFSLHTDSRLVENFLAMALDLVCVDCNPLQEIIHSLAKTPVLLVLDNCEHLVQRIGELAEQLLRQLPQAHLLITSREPLRSEGEQVFPLEPLACPESERLFTAEQLMDYPGVQLFMSRVQALLPDLQLSAEQVDAVGRICRRLDGLPLALELAAARVPVFGFAELERRLDNRFSFLTKGRRTALARHQTLKAVIDWSYDSLTANEAGVWRSLAVFAGRFDLEAVLAVNPDFSEANILDLMDGLVAKSLVRVMDLDGRVSFALLESMRYFALDLLQQHGELEPIRHRHALYCLKQTQQPLDEWNADTPANWLQVRKQDVADIKLALHWAFAEPDKHELAIRLATESAPLWYRSLQLSEIQLYLEQAWHIARSRLALLPADLIAKLGLALGHVRFHHYGASAQVAELFQLGLQYAAAAQEQVLQIQLTWSLYAHSVLGADDASLEYWSRAYLSLTSNSSLPQIAATRSRTQMINQYTRGHFTVALALGEEAMQLEVRQPLTIPAHVYCYDHLVAASAFHARSLWIAGQTNEAIRLIIRMLDRAQSIRQPYALGYFLVCGLCPVALWQGDTQLACYGIDMLLRLNSGMPAQIWKAGGQVFSEALKILSDHASPDTCLGEMNRFYGNLLGTIDYRFLPEFAGTSPAWPASAWCEAEIIRARAMAVKHHGGSTAEIQKSCCEAYQLARRQGALSWQLRAAMSLKALGWPGSEELLLQTMALFPQHQQTKDWKEACLLLNPCC
ncbi:winged helix-turn-helix domain-containing protein [Rheinheimera sp.]|uniref:ATP-binding protein n=1 Tax=Rheinheimera sp. TaxID=1869214 RepID=UPI00307E2A15